MRGDQELSLNTCLVSYQSERQQSGIRNAIAPITTTVLPKRRCKIPRRGSMAILPSTSGQNRNHDSAYSKQTQGARLWNGDDCRRVTPDGNSTVNCRFPPDDLYGETVQSSLRLRRRRRQQGDPNR